MKLVQAEAESEALRQFLRHHRGDDRLTSALALVEVVRAVQSGGPPAVAQAQRQVARMHLVPLERDVLDRAATIAPGTVLRSHDAVHLASAQLVASDLRAVVTYDARMADAAVAMGWAVAGPA